jgi:hypothetical protein
MSSTATALVQNVEIGTGSGLVHDEGDSGEALSCGIGYIYVREINGETPRRSQFIPYILDCEKSLRTGDHVTFEISSNKVYPCNGVMAGSPMPDIKMAKNVEHNLDF